MENQHPKSPMRTASDATLLPPHGGYRKLKSFQVAQLVYDLTVRFWTGILKGAAERTIRWFSLDYGRKQPAQTAACNP